MFVLETKRLTLRDMVPGDESAFVAISRDRQYQRFYSESDCKPAKYRELTRLFIAQAGETPRKSYQLAIESKQSGRFIGVVCLRLEENNQASMGFGLAREIQGRGLGYEAAKRLMDFGFTELGIHRVYAETISQNLAAIKLCESLGMRQEAHFSENRFFKNRWWNTVVFAVLRSEWGRRL